MFLKQLAIRRKDSWEDKNRPLVGSVWFENTDGNEVKINIDEATSIRIVNLCAVGIISAASELGQAMVEDLALTTPQLESRA